MLRFLCDERPSGGRLTRREWLRVSGLAGMGALAPKGSSVASGPVPAAGALGRAKSVILVFTGGGVSQLDTFDPKPAAPKEIRGEFRVIPSAVPGTRLCEHLPSLARLANDYAIVRSMSHGTT